MENFNSYSSNLEGFLQRKNTLYPKGVVNKGTKKTLKSTVCTLYSEVKLKTVFLWDHG